MGPNYYLEMVTDTDAVTDKINHEDNGFAMSFISNIHKVKLNKEMISALLTRAEEIYELPEPPVGVEGCKDCSLLEGLVYLIR